MRLVFILAVQRLEGTLRERLLGTYIKTCCHSFVYGFGCRSERLERTASEVVRLGCGCSSGLFLCCGSDRLKRTLCEGLFGC